MARARRCVNAVVLAGGPPDAVAAAEPGAPNKAFVRVGGVALVERVLTALRATPGIERLVVVAPPRAHAAAALAAADERRPDGPRMIDSLTSGLEGFPAADPVLIAASDLPLLEPRAVRAFADAAIARDLDVAYAIVAKRDHVAAYPAVPHTWARLAEGAYCGGGLVVMKPRVLPALRGVLDDLGRARKSPLRLAGLFGCDVLLRFALGTLRIEDAERRASRILGAPAGAVRSPYPEIAVNVDRVSDVPLTNDLAAKGSKTVP